MISNNQSLMSPVRTFYEGQTVFITGGTGFMGKVLIEKLLRTCYDVKKLIILGRPKKGYDIEKRFEKQFSDVLYEKLKKEKPNFMEKIYFVHGDLNELNLGLSKENFDMICKEVTVIFNLAATVRFDETLSVAVKINVRGTRDVVLIAKQSPNLKAFLHVSTAYSNCVVDHIEEKFYDSSISPENLISLIETLDEDTLRKITPTLLGKYPNTYTYTKVAAENVIRNMTKGLPAAVIRPSIIISTYKDPVPGWTDGIFGPTGMIMGAGLGILHTIYCNGGAIAELVPADHVINACIVIASEAAKIQESSKEKFICLDENNDIELLKADAEQAVSIYNFVSCNRNPINWKRFVDILWCYGNEMPTILAMWAPFYKMNKNFQIHFLYTIFLHYIPAYIIDGIATCLGKKPMLVKTYQKFDKLSNAVSYFINGRWYFKTDNIERLASRMTSDDKETFNFDISNMSWDEYGKSIIQGIRLYLFKDPMETVERAKKRVRIQESINTVICIFLGLSLLWILMSCFKMMNLF